MYETYSICYHTYIVCIIVISPNSFMDAVALMSSSELIQRAQSPAFKLSPRERSVTARERTSLSMKPI